MNLNKFLFIFWLIIIIIIILLFLIPTYDCVDCYDVYVEECKHCHSINMSYTLCSGFCLKSDNISTGCETDLDKKCEDNIPHDYCVIPICKFKFGLINKGD